jgi:hypothetical protein
LDNRRLHAKWRKGDYTPSSRRFAEKGNKLYLQTGRGNFMKYVYPACFYPEPDEWFSVEFTGFELATFGNDPANAMYRVPAIYLETTIFNFPGGCSRK